METSWGAMLHRPAHYKACQACTRSSAAEKHPRGRLYDGEVKAPDFFKSKLAHCRLRCCGLWINFRLESQGRSGSAFRLFRQRSAETTTRPTREARGVRFADAPTSPADRASPRAPGRIGTNRGA